MPSRDTPRFGPTGTGAPFLAHDQRAVGGPRMPEVVAHETFDPLARLGAGISQQIGGPLLHLVAEDVLIPSRIQVQRRTHAQQEVLSLIDPCRIGRPTPQQQWIGQHRNRARRRQIAKRTGRLLDIGLELIQRRVEARVPRIDQFEQRLQDVRVRRGRVKQRTESIEQQREVRRPGAHRAAPAGTPGCPPRDVENSSSSRTW